MIPTAKDDESNMLWGGFSLAGTGKLGRTDVKVDGVKYRTILGNSSYSLQTTLGCGWRFQIRDTPRPEDYKHLH